LVVATHCLVVVGSGSQGASYSDQASSSWEHLTALNPCTLQAALDKRGAQMNYK